MNQNIQNPNQNNPDQMNEYIQNTPDRMSEYIQNQRPSTIIGNNNEQIIIPPLNTDIRFNAYHDSSFKRGPDGQPLRSFENGKLYKK